jgi:hypothetical protein
MSRLNKMQVEHLTSRISVIMATLLEKELAAKMPALPKPPPALTEREMHNLIDAGKAKLLPFENAQYYRTKYLYQSFSYPSFDAKQKIYYAACKVWEAKAAPIRARYAKEEQRMKDEAILGDSAAAMKTLAALEKKLSG